MNIIYRGQALFGKSSDALKSHYFDVQPPKQTFFFRRDAEADYPWRFTSSLLLRRRSRGLSVGQFSMLCEAMMRRLCLVLFGSANLLIEVLEGHVGFGSMTS